MNKLLLSGLMVLLIIPFFSCTTESEKMTEMTAIDDPHSFSKPDESVVTHLDWYAEVDFEKKEIRAVATLTLKNSAEANTVILDTKALNVEEVKADGEATEYKLGEGNEVMGKPLQISISPSTEKVAITYTTSPEAEALQWLSPGQTADSLGPFLFTQSQAILARSWVPIQDSPGLRFTYNAQVIVPDGMLALMSAKNPRTLKYQGPYTFEMKQPIPAYLLALAVGHLSYVPLGERSGVYAEPSVMDRAAYEFEDLESMITAAEELYGKYRWEQYDLLVLPPSFPFGGMENPRLTFATPTILAGDKSLTSLVAHELAHSWSGNLVTNATWNDFWLNEGFTVYFEQRIMEKLYGRDYSEMLASLAADDLQTEVEKMISEGNGDDTKLKLDLEGRNPDDGVTTVAYDKGYLLLRTIEESVGRENFDTFLKNYFERNAFKVKTTEQFLEELDAELLSQSEGISLDQVKRWVYEPGLPEQISLPSSDKFANVENELSSYLEGSAPARLSTKDWSSHEWLHFVRLLPEDISNSQLVELDAAFGFTETGNSEVLTAWLLQAIKHNYKPAYPRLEDFLVNTGRRKFLSPLYAELIKTAEGEAFAKEVYNKARPNYHFVATNTIDEMLK